MQKQSFEMELGGKILRAEFNDLTNQAAGSVMLYYSKLSVSVPTT